VKKPEVHIVEEIAASVSHEDARLMMVGPGHNEPDPFPGYLGFVGWTAPILIKHGPCRGDLLVGFSAGYWHASPPLPFQGSPETLQGWINMGMPAGIEAPTGGRAMSIRSSDSGRSWSHPETIINTPHDDRSPNFIELDDGTILCCFFRYTGLDQGAKTNVLRSTDGGHTWSEPLAPESPFEWDATDGPFLLLRDGTVLLPVYGGTGETSRNENICVLRSTDNGVTWEAGDVIEADFELTEMGIAQLPDDRIVMIIRSEGAIVWSDDGGKSWTKPAKFGMRMYEPGLLVLDDGTLACFYGSYNKHPDIHGIMVMFSRDGGETWIAPAPDYGFTVDPSVYGYGSPILLPDGSILLTYLDSGGHTSEDAQTEKLWSMRIRVREDLRGIERLPNAWMD
jgi:hypothetical protein